MFAHVWRYAQRFISSRFETLGRNRRSQRGRQSIPLWPHFENLEQRRLLSANQITFDSVTSAIVIQGSSQNDSVTIAFATDNTIHVQLETADGYYLKTFEPSTVASVRFFGGDGDDTFHNFSQLPSVAYGEAGNDVLNGGFGDDHLIGGEGDDSLIGSEGDDVLDAGDGNDWLSGWMGNDTLMGGAGDDYLGGGDGDDILYGGAGADELQGGNGNDQLWGGDDDDELVGGLGDDTIHGDAGDDRLSGEEGDDSLYGDDGNDWLSGWTGNDVLVGGAGDDLLGGGDGDDWLSGEDGDDQLEGGDGDDWMSGWTGNDTLKGGPGNDFMGGGAGDDSLSGEDGDDVLMGDDGNDWLSGWTGNDHLAGGFGDDTLGGGDGDDWLNGEDGDDELLGGDGDDWMSGWTGNDTLKGGPGNDFMGGGAGDDSLSGEDGDDVLMGDDGNDWLSGGIGDDEIAGGWGDDFLTGGDGDDRLSGEDGDDELQGDDGNDWLSGWTGNDILVGGSGDDLLGGGDGDDSLSGQDGDDQLFGDDGNDLLSGWTGNDIEVGGAGDDTIGGGEGDDWLSGEDGNDQLDGGDGNDWLAGGAGNDKLEGAAGDDYLVAGEGDDSLDGWLGNDLLDGGAGSDRLVGGEGQDVLIGGLGQDELIGNQGDDLLLGGTTIYEGDADKYRALLSVWSAALPYTTRIEQIEDELFMTRLQSQETVFDDGISDVLFGNEGQDWFFLTGSLPAYRPEEVEVHGDDAGDQDGHNHGAPLIVHDLPALEGFDLIDSLDSLVQRQSDEKIHTLIPHSDSPALQREHLALFELVRYDQVTHLAVRSGAWSDPSTWANGKLPSDGARVLIPLGVDVTVDGMIAAQLATVRVDGLLAFDATGNTELRVDTVVVSGTGTFQMGTANAPIAAGVRARLLFTDSGPIDRDRDPFAISRGLISHGKVSVYGSEVTSYAAISGPLPAGSQTLVLKTVPLDWKAGDTVVIAGTTNGFEQNEVREIAAIAGNSLVLDQPLSYTHAAPASNLDVHVGNLSRNAVFESQSPVIDRRGHVMFMHTRNVDVEYAGFYRLGRTNKLEPINDPVVGSDWKLEPGTGTNPRARYPVHFHRNGITSDGNPSLVVGSVVVDSPGWGFVNHSSYVDMIQNVAYDVTGAAFSTEVGDEIGGFYKNLAVGSTGSHEDTNARETPLQDFGHQGDGFWFQGAGISVVGNISAGNQGHAYAFYTRGLYQAKFLSANLADPSIAGGAPTIDIGQVPMTNFENNIGYASDVGLLIRYHLQDSTHGQDSVFENSQFWNNTTGVSLLYAQNTVLRSLTVVRTPDDQYTYGINSAFQEGNIVYDNLTVVGYDVGIKLPRWGDNVVRGGRLDNRAHDILIHTARWRDRSVLITGLIDTPRITLWDDIEQPIPDQGDVTLYFVSDRLILDFGPFDGQQFYYLQQQADFVPFPSARPDIPSIYVGLTQRQLWNEYGVALGGAIAPSDASAVPSIIGGLVAPLTIALVGEPG